MGIHVRVRIGVGDVEAKPCRVLDIGAFDRHTFDRDERSALTVVRSFEIAHRIRFGDLANRFPNLRCHARPAYELSSSAIAWKRLSCVTEISSLSPIGRFAW